VSPLRPLIEHVRPEDYGIGMPGDRVVLAAYDDRWPQLYTAVEQYLLSLLPIVKMYHVGSTSIPNMPAKPILDIVATATNLHEVEDMRPALETLGGEWRGEFGIVGRRYVPFSSDGLSMIHLHLYGADHADPDRMVQFRDWMRTHDDDAAAYAELKQACATRFGFDRLAYTEAKGPFIASIFTKIEGQRG